MYCSLAKLEIILFEIRIIALLFLSDSVATESDSVRVLHSFQNNLNKTIERHEKKPHNREIIITKYEAGLQLGRYK